MLCTIAALCAFAAALGPSEPVYASRALVLDRAAAAAPAGSNRRAELEREIALEERLDQLLLGRISPTIPVPGDNELLVSDSAGRDAAAVYVPTVAGNDGYSLVVLLHGRGETETDVVTRGIFRSLADRHSAILYAPFARGSDAWDPSSQDAIVATVDELKTHFHIPTERCYLAGISMGGAGTFHVAAAHSERFAAFMSIIGYLNLDDAPSLRMRMRTKPVYLVEGGADPIMGPQAYGETERAFAALGIASGIYRTPRGTHSIESVEPSIERAWDDMFGGIVRRVGQAAFSKLAGDK